MGETIAFFLPSLAAGGAERVCLNLCRGMAQEGHRVELLLCSKSGEYLSSVPDSVTLVDLGANSVTGALFPLLRYLKRARPAVLCSHMAHANVVALLAARLSGVAVQTAAVEHTTLQCYASGGAKDRLIPLAQKVFYPLADSVVTVSRSLEGELSARLRLPAGKVRTIYNPVLDERVLRLAGEGVEHPWFADRSVPVFLSAGRLAPEKDFLTLLKAFRLVRQKREARLVILGEGGERKMLEEYLAQHDLGESVWLPGFEGNPYRYMARASAYVLSSRFEALPTSLIEAMACGCPVVSTNCLHGPAEVLKDGTLGALVPVGDAAGLAEGMLAALRTPQREALVERSRDFSQERSVQGYLELFGCA